MSDAYTPEIMYYLKRLASFSTNQFKLMPQTGATATANQIVRVQIPNNALVNMRSLKFFFFITTTGAAAGARLPNNLETLISRYELLASGVQISGGANFHGVLVKAKEALLKPSCDPVLSHPYIVREKSPVNGVVLAGTDNESYPAHQQCIQSWCGVLDSIQPPIISSAELPDLTLVLYLADNSVLGSCGGIGFPGNTTAGVNTFDGATGARNAEYQLSNMHFSIECMSLNDSVYPNMIQETIANRGSLDVGFTQYQSWQEVTASALRFGLSCQSLSRLYSVHRDPEFNTQEEPIRLVGYKKWNDTATTAPATDEVAGVAGYDSGGTQNLSNNTEGYTFTCHNFPEPAGTNKKFQWSINSSLYPQWQATSEEAYAITRNSVLGDPQLRHSLQQMQTNYSVQCIRLNLDKSEYSRVQSGLNLRGINGNLFYNMYGLTGSARAVNVFAEINSTLMIGEGKQISVVV